MKVLATKQEFDQEVGTDKVVVIDFFATWCGPCVMIAPYFQTLSEDFPAASFVKVDVDENPDTAEHCEIQAMPTFQVWKNSAKIGELTGASQEKLLNLVKVALGQ